MTERQPITIDTGEDRYSRLRMIPWWDQELLSRSKVMVVGAGALGNEIIKNLALLGVGNVLIVDFDRVELANLSRSVLYSESDEGVSKVHAAVAAARRLNPDCRVAGLDADVTREVGLGLFRWADVVICGLDSREARLAVNQNCWKVGRAWVDGATESFQGVARVFTPPDGPCYECTLGERDIQLLEARNSCGFIAREAYRQGRTPTTPTTSAIVAGIQVQEALKILHKDAHLSGLSGKGFFIDGITLDSFIIEYVRREDCLSHESIGRIIDTDLSSRTASLLDVRAVAERYLEGEIVIELPSEMVTNLTCGVCHSAEPFYRLLPSISADDALCPHCGVERVPEVETQSRGDEPYARMSLESLGFPVMDVITARSTSGEVGIEIGGDWQTLTGGAW